MNSDKLKSIISKNKSIRNTYEGRETSLNLEQFNEVIDELIDDNNMKNLWNEYVLKNVYAKDVKYEDTIEAIKQIMDLLQQELVIQ